MTRKGVFSSIAEITSDIEISLINGLLVLWSILIDYISLFKTRGILRILMRLQLARTVAIAIFGMDYIVYRLLFFMGLIILFWVSYNDFERPEVFVVGISFQS